NFAGLDHRALEFPRHRLRHLGRDGRCVSSQRSHRQLRRVAGRQHRQCRSFGGAPAGRWVGDADPGADRDANTYTDGNADTGTDAYANPYTHGDANTVTHGHADSSTYRHADAGADRDSNTYTDANADTG